MGRPRRKSKVPRSALGIESHACSNRFEQRGLSGPVLADEECYGGMKPDGFDVPDGRQVERVFLPRGNFGRIQPDLEQKWLAPTSLTLHFAFVNSDYLSGD